MNDTNQRIDDAAADEQAFDDMMAEGRLRRMMADTSDVVEPKVTDFTEIVASVGQDGDYVVRVLLDCRSGPNIVVTPWVCKEEAERLELAINEVMIEFRAKRNAWEKELVAQAPPATPRIIKNIVDDLVAEQDDGECLDEKCSGSIVEGMCSLCEDEWAYKLVNAKPPSKTLLRILAKNNI